MPIQKRGRLLSILKLHQVAFTLSLLTTACLAYQIVPPFWAAQIDSALQKRDTYYESILPDSSSRFSLILLDDRRQNELCASLQSRVDSLNPWYNFVCGMLECDSGTVQGTTYLTSALSLAHADPGTTWALFVECTRNRQAQWAERCLMFLEKQFLESGARSAPAIAQQLLFYAQQAEKQKDSANAASLYRWAERFDRDQIWSSFYRVRTHALRNPPRCMAAIGQLIGTVSASWVTQLEIAEKGYGWLRLFFLFFIIIVFTGLGLRHLPKPLHSFADHLPEQIPAMLKTVLPLAVLCSIVSFGLIPFLWLLVFLLWHFLEKKERFLVGFCVALLTLTPLDARIQDMFLRARMPQGQLALFTRTLQEGYTSDVCHITQKSVLANTTDPLAWLSASLCRQKSADTAAAIAAAEKAFNLASDDQVVLVNAGNALFMSGRYDTAAAYFRRALELYPGLLCARFNLAQSFARKSDTTIDPDFIKALPIDDQNRVAAFIKTNNVYFNNTWPPLRQVMAPEYTPGYFWGTLFPDTRYSGSWKSTRSMWGGSFLGVPPLASLILFLGLVILLLVWSVTPLAQKTLPLVSTCRLCSCIVCDQCKKGELCSSCNQATQYIRNVKTLASIQSRIRSNVRLLRRLGEYLLDICLPASGMLYSSRSSFALIIPLSVVTAAVYASCIHFSTINLTYPNWAAFGPGDQPLWLCALYNVFFIGRALVAVFRRKVAAQS